MTQNCTKSVFFLMLFLLAIPTYAQISVTGKVTSQEDGGPLPGVSVLVQGSTTGAVTDLDGEYTIEVPSGDVTLEFSFIGFSRQRVQVRNRSELNVVMVPDIAQLSEVVVTAFGIEQEKKALVSATQEVKGRELALSREPNMVDALNAKVAGVQVTRQGGSAGAASSIVIRGMSSISGENQPLFVVDGIPINNEYRTRSRSSGVDAPNRAIDINPNDIESMNVLKGPAATALYGIQAASGVVIITTKKGSRSDTQNLSVNFSSNTGVDRIMQNFPAQMTYAQGDRGVHGTTTFGHFGPPLSTLRFNGQDTHRDPRGLLVDMNDPSATNQMMDPVNNQDVFFQDGLTLDNSISVSTGNKHSSFYISMGDFSQTGIIPNNKYNRRSFKVTGESSLTEKLRVTASANYVHSTSTRFGRGDNFADVVQGSFRTPPSFDNSLGHLRPDGGQRSFRDNSPDNPFWTVNNNPYEDEVNRIIGFIQANYDPLDWLNIMYRIGTDVSSDKRNQQWAVGSFGGDALPGGRVQETTYNDRLLNSDLIITANTQLGEDFNLQGMVGQNFYSRSYRMQFFDGRNLAIPGLYRITNAQTNLVQDQFTELKQTAAVFSRVSVDFRNYAFLEATGRNEWTSTLLPPNNSFFYGSVGTGFVFTEAFNLDQGFFSFGKLRASYSEAGRDTNPYRDQTYFGRSSISGAWGGGLVFPLPSGVGGVQLAGLAGNPNLRPERNKTWEFGGEFRFAENRLGLDVTYYRERNVDQIIAVSEPGSTGFSSRWINAGTIENRGWEIVANASPLVGDFKWDIVANFSRNRNVVLDLPVDRYALAGFGNLRPSLVEGQPYGIFMGTGFLRDDQGNRIINENGYPQRVLPSDENPSGDIIIGDPTPDFLLGLRNNLSYKNFLLTFLWDIRVGGDVANVTANWMRAQGVGAFTEDRGSQVIFRGVKGDGSPNDIPVVIDDARYYNNTTGNRDIAERFIEDGSWVRLRDITLTYQVPSAIANRLKMRNLDVSLYGRNLLLFTAYTGVDPETNLAGPNSSIGVDAFGTPTTRSVGINLSAQF
ncbi:SusC/RagA family TonB-linked outer membrane protein [Litoribacter populi]|uniref:SusC/RagA family TonB-linked outer membrane protein n=1 Tax=Litoribacter populi TaxID=2598460 RepID=UPI00117D2BB9|nr:SusC/RagA family TonB-linked outer membrane protein [Litoribacter populi]